MSMNVLDGNEHDPAQNYLSSWPAASVGHTDVYKVKCHVVMNN